MNEVTNNKKTAFYWDETCFWHGGGNYATVIPVGGFVQPLVAGGLPEAPETKRRLKNLIEATGLSSELAILGACKANTEDLLRIHPMNYLKTFKALSDKGGGELGLRTPFGPGGFEIAAKSAGLVKRAVTDVAQGRFRNAYALSRPPGHHCLPDWPNGFCLLANIAIAIEAAKAAKLVNRVAVVDWDVHHGNGTEHIFYDRDDVLTISIHQDRCYPHDTGSVDCQGEGKGLGYNVNIPLPAGSGHQTYLEAMQKIVLPKLRAFEPDMIVIACGFDASAVDPIARMLCGSHTFREMTRMLMTICEKIVAAHEGGYSELHVPFCGHAVLEELSNSKIHAPDPIHHRITVQQPDERNQAHQSDIVRDLATALV
ncbi:class II histone deacetylase [Thalassospira lucentensis]|uniref:class II histone deacetylase n=1 Tax=Thalassospira lucentensis TaxID=168935 RepID=UPI003AA90B68